MTAEQYWVFWPWTRYNTALFTYVSDSSMSRVSLVTQRWRIRLLAKETWVQSLGREDPLKRKWLPPPAFLPEESHGWRSLVGLQSVHGVATTGLSHFLFQTTLFFYAIVNVFHFPFQLFIANIEKYNWSLFITLHPAALIHSLVLIPFYKFHWIFYIDDNVICEKENNFFVLNSVSCLAAV